MSDSVDRDATADLTTLEVNLLRKDVAFWIEQSDIWKHLANDERDVTDRLRAVIENAPHFPGCELFTAVNGQWMCTCWKADAL
jgi:hypothetical protein